MRPAGGCMSCDGVRFCPWCVSSEDDHKYGRDGLLMDRSSEIGELAKALVSFGAENISFSKSSSNPHFRSKYTSLEDLVDVVRPVLSKHGLAVSQFPSGDGELTTYLIHASGQFISHVASLKMVKADPQAMGSAITYLKRYSLQSVLCLAADPDDDAEAAMVRPEVKSAPTRTGSTKPW